MKKILIMAVILLLAVMVLPACGGSDPAAGDGGSEEVSDTKDVESNDESDAEDDIEMTEEMLNMTKVRYEMKMKIGDTPVSVDWEDNEAVDALAELVSGKLYEIDLSMYGGFEQVGAIGEALPADDHQTTTKAGDIVLYSGDQIVVFYGSNSWAYTRLGHITDKSESEMAELLGNGDVTISIYTEFSE